MSDELKIHVVAAEPGWFCLIPVKDDDGKFLEFWPEIIVAWRIETLLSADSGCLSDAYPIGINSLQEDQGILLRPDGKVIFVADCDFPNVDAAMKYMLEKK